MFKTIFNKIIYAQHEPIQGYVKKLISVLVGIAGVYLAMFWIADAKYGNAIGRLESRTTNLVTRLESNGWCKAIVLVPSLQNRKIPLKPNFFNVPSVIKSLRSSYDEVDLEIIAELQDLMISKKGDLNNLDLKSVVLERSDFSRSNLANSTLENSSLKYSSFINSNLSNTHLNGSFLEYVDFTNSELQGAVLNDSNMEGCILAKAKLLGAELENVNLSNSDLSSCNLHLSNLKGAKLYNSNLSETNLVGVDFENARGLDKANLSNAKYNSLVVEQHEIPLYNEVAIKLCEKFSIGNKSVKKFFHDDSICEVLKDFELTYGPPTKFPAGFDPKSHKMVDISELLTAVKARKY